MMIAVLIDSRRVGSSGWINVRSTQKILVRGMLPGDELVLRGDNNVGIKLFHDTEIALNGETMVRAEIVKISEGSRIYVDLE